ncbi:EEF1A lysine methyltransferase 2 isoform X1 [Ambystoma mexicanum]|uniref:EEF1A lysine methyltransferase 2 isoform X1 n=1 Tax=Ambystoma mexicanum TaxID=8296 RepID=UPI0037E856F5
MLQSSSPRWPHTLHACHQASRPRLAHLAPAMSACQEDGLTPEDSFLPSRLGTKEHWDTAYRRELEAFLEYGDAGEVWFGEESVARLLRWLQKQKVPLDAAILDIGTGNGLLLVELANSGYTNLTGIDYSAAAIELSKSIMEREERCRSIKLQVEDFLNPSEELLAFDLCVDKGTFDAISLDPECAAEKRQRYLASLRRVLKDNGHFLITSCNWTREELISQYTEGFDFMEELPTPKFSFGGRTGSSVTALVFKKKP